MGSPKEESQRGFEKPRHEVVIQTRFRMAAVPVTNVSEWTLSPWTHDYSGWEGGHGVDPAADHAAADTGSGDRVIRGGGYWNAAGDARAAFRLNWEPDFGDGALGFRLLLPPSPPEPGS